MVLTVKWFQALSILLFCISRLSFATVVQSVEIEAMLANSELVFEGRVIGQEVEAGSGKRAIHTWFTFEISDVIKGRYANKTLKLKFLGGTIGEKSLSVGNMHVPTFGEKGIYFVERLEQRQVHPLYGWDQGHFIIKTDRKTQIEQIQTRNLQPIYAINPQVKRKHQSQAFAFSSGIAKGIQTQALKRGSQPLTADQFKLQLRQLMAQEDG